MVEKSSVEKQGPQEETKAGVEQVNVADVQAIHQATFNLPKIELHAHIGGCFRPQTFMELVLAKGLDLDNIDFYNVTIETAFEFFRLGAQLVTDIPTLQRVTYEIIEDYEKQNTRYLELRSSPKQYGDKTKEDCVRAILEVIEQAASDMPTLKVRFLLSINRTGSIEAARETLALAKEIDSPYIVGVELSGDPRSGEFSTFEDELRTWKEETGKKISLHCAETEEQKEEAQAMIDFNPDRLGHCCYLTMEQLQEVAAKGIPVEVCPTSNLAAYPEAYGATKGLPHLVELQRLDHNFCICCDDTMLFSTNLSTEMFEYATAFGVTPAKLKQRLIRNVDMIFDDSCKEWLREQIESYRL